MRRLACLLIALCTGLAAPIAADDFTAADRAEIKAIIEAQLDAFQRDDAAAAFSYASPSIQAKFGDAETFMAMVKEGYQPVYRPRAVEFRDLSGSGNRATQRVLVVGPLGVAFVAH